MMSPAFTALGSVSTEMIPQLGADVFFYFVEVFVGECVHNQILKSFLLSKSCLFDSIVLLFTTMMQEIMVII